jgi:hypothetical protein
LSSSIVHGAIYFGMSTWSLKKNLDSKPHFTQVLTSRMKMGICQGPVTPP